MAKIFICSVKSVISIFFLREYIFRCLVSFSICDFSTSNQNSSSVILGPSFSNLKDFNDFQKRNLKKWKNIEGRTTKASTRTLPVEFKKHV